MKTSIQLAASVVALTGLLVGAASQATPLSELPLKASVLAKPNVILGMDDSGSMDSEIMLDAADGVMWWNFDTGRGWDTAGVLYRHVNLGEYWSSTWRRYFYLFPNGNGTGLNIKPENGVFAVVIRIIKEFVTDNVFFEIDILFGSGFNDHVVHPLIGISGHFGIGFYQV